MTHGSLDSWLIYLDEDFVVVNKPPGLPSVPGKNPRYSKNLYHLLQDQLPPVYTVHRLDINTSGLILFARTYAAQRYFHRLFRERLVTKEYLALVDGQLAADAGEINLPITCDWPNRPKQKICFAQGKHSITRFRRLQQNQNQSLVLLSPITGRSHQLRIHMSMIGHPISGCKLYGNGEPDARLMLHAYRLSLQHPGTGKTISFSCYPEFLSSVQGHLLD